MGVGGRPIVLAVLGLALTVPAAPAATGITLGSGIANVVVTAGNCMADKEDFRQTVTLSFSEAISVNGNGQGPGCFSGTSTSTAASSQTSSIVDSTNGVAITGDANVSGDVNASNGLGSAELQRDFTVTQPVPWTITGSLGLTMAPALCCPASLEVKLDGSEDGGGSVQPFLATSAGSFSSSGTLAPGQYTFRAATHCQASENDIGDPESPDTANCHANWQVDLQLGQPAASPVAVAITAGPSGTVSARDATFEFTTVDPNPPTGQFECRIDTFGFAPCTSPKTFTSIPDGQHRVEIRYDPTGADPPGPVAARDWTIQPPPDCPDITIGHAVVQGCFTERLTNGQPTGVFEAGGEAWIGGFHIDPLPGGLLVVDTSSTSAPFTAEGNGVEWVLGPAKVPAPLPELLPFVTDFSFSLNTAGTLERFVNLPLLRGFSAQIKSTWQAGGKGSKIEASVSMEDLTKSLGKPLAGQLGLGSVSIGTLAGKLSLALANGKPTEVTDGELEVPEVAVELKGTNPPIKDGFGGGKVKAKRIDAQTVEWSGEVTILFPWAGRSGPNQGSITGRLVYRNFELAGLGFAVSGFEVPVGKSGWNITGVQGDWLYRPTFSGNVGITAQQKTKLQGAPLLKLTGNLKGLTLAEADCSAGKNPFEFVGTFNSPVVEAQNIGELKGTLTMCAYVPNGRNFAFEAGLSGELTVDAGNVKKLFVATGSAKGWFSGFDFNLDGSFATQLPVFGTISANGVLSSEGYAFCGRVGFIEAGLATDNWLEAPSDIGVCDFTPFRAVASPRGGARAAATGSERVRIPAGQTAFGITVRGAEGADAPRVRVTGPGGAQFTAPTGDKALKTTDAIIAPADTLGAAYVYLRKPRAGVWKIETLDGSAAIARVETARQLPAPRVRARVKLKGNRVLVTWTSRRVPGQQLELVDRADGVAKLIQPRTSRRSGRVVFTPENRLATQRSVEAVITQDGTPRPALTVRRYRLRAAKPPGRVSKAKAKRTTKGLTVSWRKAPRAKDYVVTLSAGTEVLVRAITKKLAVTLTGAPTSALTVRITARDSFGRQGKPVAVKVAEATR